HRAARRAHLRAFPVHPSAARATPARADAAASRRRDGARDDRAHARPRTRPLGHRRPRGDRPLRAGRGRLPQRRRAEQGRAVISPLTDPQAWAALVTLSVLEIVLGIDNVVFISVLVARLDPARQRRARRIGLALALAFRIGFLFMLVWLAALTTPLVTV